VQDLTIDTETGLTPYRFALHGADQATVNTWGLKLAKALNSEASLRDVNAPRWAKGAA
jgi:multidrug efflux pump